MTRRITHHLLVAICASAILGSLAPIARAQKPPTEADHPPFDGCGKAHAMIARYPHGLPTPTAAQREAMSETDVLHYDLAIEVTDLDPVNNTCHLDGTNTITLQSKSTALSQFTFRLSNGFSVPSVEINGTTPATVTNTSPTTWVVDLDQTYAMDDIITITIAYNGYTSSVGFGSIEIDTHGSSPAIPVVATLSEPYLAYTWWPAKDGDYGLPGDNSDKATLTFAITVPDTFTAVTQGLLQNEETLSGNRKRYTWHTDYQTVTYLVSLAATEYNHWTETYTYPGGTMPVEFYIYPSVDNTTNRAAWSKCIDMLEVFRPLYGEYPFVNEKYGIYNFPFGGGMEHQTLSGQGPSYGFNESLTAHELGHQWWGDMITCKTWSDIWLNEGFAEYTECLWEEYKSGTQDIAAYLNATQFRKPASVNGTVYVYPEDTNSISRIFSGTFSYRKGCWVLHQLRHTVGDEVFFDILADYRAAYAFSAADTDDFAAVASSTYGSDLSWFFQQWVYQPGAPAYRYGWDKVNIANQDYLLVHIEQTQGGSYPQVFIMPIDLHAQVGGDNTVKTVFNNEREEWFVIPVDQPITQLDLDPHEWILATSRAPIAYLPGPPKIVATEPTAGAVVDAGDMLDEITVTFHTPVDLATEDISLVGADTGPVAFSLALGTEANPVVLTLATPLTVDAYTLTIGTGLTASNSGMALDGEMADPPTLPSGDGAPGGTAVLHFTVAASIPATQHNLGVMLFGWLSLIGIGVWTLRRQRPGIA